MTSTTSAANFWRGGRIWISGSETTSAPSALSATISAADCDAARVMTTRLPASGDETCSATLAIDLLQNFAGTGIDEQLGDFSAKFASLIGRSGGALANVLLAVRRADHRVEN